MTTRRRKPVPWGTVTVRNPMVVFPALEWARMQVANEGIEDLDERIDEFVDAVLAFTRPLDTEPEAVAA